MTPDHCSYNKSVCYMWSFLWWYLKSSAPWGLHIHGMTTVHARFAKLLLMKLTIHRAFATDVGGKGVVSLSLILTNEHKWERKCIVGVARTYFDVDHFHCSPAFCTICKYCELKRPTLHLVLQNFQCYFWNDACKIRCLIQTWKSKLDLLTFFMETRLLPIMPRINWLFRSAVSSSKFASDENCCCFAPHTVFIERWM